MVTIVNPRPGRRSIASLAWELHDKAQRAEKKKKPEAEEPAPAPVVKRPFGRRKPADKPAKASKAKPADKSQLALPKEHASQDGTYMAIVRRLACRRCGNPPPSEKKGNEFCHRDEGKGTSLKTDVREGWSGCPPCHKAVGEGKMPRPEKRRLNLEYAASTRAEVEALGLWPKKLPKWSTKP